ncbi:hypothetical protein SAMN06298214_0911 [Bacteroidales bacterium WCE2004]|nr:hypothetical protein SAMN06298214_0911 [Bacteroidales bacterium WCE2004]
MRKLFNIIVLFLLVISAYGQNSGALKFLGIPIDGSKAQFVAALKAKGFYYSSVSEGYKGQFNGNIVDVYVHTNHDLVDRIYVAFPDKSEGNIKIEFNRLLAQFKKSDKYVDFSFNEPIPDAEDVSYEITVHDKRYQAVFQYYDSNRGYEEITEKAVARLAGLVPDDILVKLNDLIIGGVDRSDEEQSTLSLQVAAELQRIYGQDEMKAYEIIMAFLDGMKSAADGDVWFMIIENGAEYHIGLYYDNLHNMAHGEDL